MFKLSIIIPVLNEESFLEKQKKLLMCFIKEEHEVIAVDGGSTDKSVKIANEAGCKTFITKPSRGYQLHFGAEQSKHDLLLFLHADTSLPINMAELISSALAPVSAHWGRFDVSFSNSKLIFRVIAWLMNQRSRVTGIVTGDQALFVKRKSYFDCGGFPDYPLMEDIVISKHLKKISSPVCLPNKVITTGRKWEKQGVIKTITKMWGLRLMFFLGLSTEKLAKLY